MNDEVKIGLTLIVGGFLAMVVSAYLGAYLNYELYPSLPEQGWMGYGNYTAGILTLSILAIGGFFGFLVGIVTCFVDTDYHDPM